MRTRLRNPAGMLRHWRNEQRATGVAPGRGGKIGYGPELRYKEQIEKSSLEKSGECCDTLEGEMRRHGVAVEVVSVREMSGVSKN